MGKIEFMTQLKNGLKGIDENTLNDILNDYEEYFINGFKEGKTEEEICRELGTPKQIIDNLFEQDILNDKFKVDNNIKNDRYNVINIILLIVLNVFLVTVLIPVIGTIVGVTITSLVALPGLIIAMVCTLFMKLIFPFFIIVAVLSADLFILVALYFLIKTSIVLFKKYVNWNINSVRRQINENIRKNIKNNSLNMYSCIFY